ncbi:MBL fold metallo-hydrolase [Halobacillus karajensis]|uniref:Hydroxyacylglutathione hydrolase n=1 Tax=Halobacillus karajensis TaxID=195088 RepID=A0A059NY04_9BACI|nr:MBL fold metallo-hydrolase [Halobacillus karajensis]CDQ21143.1 hydroxyacylglutathione hydrolase [Halobacillus karajensis]CDQ24793.1 hydroxyacylglutathione hydrolase [Halobacillus karajensis]CDQ28847.1 hydroxyacylglutathione hydrolase [Halobacillus karajensis]
MDKIGHNDSSNEKLHMEHAEAEQMLDDIAFYRTLIVNVIFIGKEGSEDWVLVDCGVKHYSKRIMEAAEKRFGTNKPKAIILTHGHFDHVGSAKQLAEEWKIPIYIHPMEMDYVTGKRDYPGGDPTVGGGLFSLLSPFFPTHQADLSKYIHPLPTDGSIPFLEDWKMIHTPGHTPGHISLFREKDRALIAGDAFITVKQESSTAVFIQHQHIHGPPAYFTHNWEDAEASVKELASLQPSVVITGHGLPMEGELLNKQLHDLAENFKELAVPKHNRKIH